MHHGEVLSFQYHSPSVHQSMKPCKILFHYYGSEKFEPMIPGLDSTRRENRPYSGALQFFAWKCRGGFQIGFEAMLFLQSTDLTTSFAYATQI